MTSLTRWILAVQFCALAAVARDAEAQCAGCPGDLSGDGEVTIDELVNVGARRTGRVPG